MSSDFSTLRSTEDIINALSTLYFNLNEIERIYYDMFINPIPMDVTFQRYDDTGKLETITLPNRAKDSQATLIGVGDPNGSVAASIGTFYVNTASYDLYYKSSGSDSQGWIMLWSGLNLVADTSFLKPDGDGSQLTNLNMSNAGSGILGVQRGGTGSAGITGIVKGNGSAPMTAAVDGVDFMGSASMTGIVAYYPVASIPNGWLRCDGSAYNRTTYANLYSKIGTTYGSGDGTTTFNVPNLMDDGNGNPFFIRCWDGITAFNTTQQSQVGVHTHPLTGNVGDDITVNNDVVTNGHQHNRGDMDIVGSFNASWEADIGRSTSGAFYYTTASWGNNEAPGVASLGQTVWQFKASNAWTGVTGGGQHTHSLAGLNTSNNSTGTDSNETRVLNKMLVPVIKY